jgi:outer membrane lipoprotein SlyB
MAIWDITVSAGSTVGSGTDVLLTTISGVVPGDFNGATIDSVVVQSAPTITSDGTTDDTIGVRFFVTTTAPADVFGGDGSDAASMCHASLGNGVASDTITDGTSRSPNPTTAVAADWDEVRYSINYTASMKNDGETMSWSAFTVRVTYTPPVAGDGPNLLTLLGVG